MFPHPFLAFWEPCFYQLYGAFDSVHRKGFLGYLVENTVGVGCLFASFQEEGVAAGYG